MATSPAVPLQAFASRFRAHFASAGIFSLVLNLLLLAPALFMLQVFDRVLTSRSTETLIMLLVLCGGALVFMAYLDAIRSRLLNSAAVALEKLLGPPVLSDMMRRSAAPRGGEALHGLRDVSALRAFLVGPGIVSLFDAPWLPLYVLVIFLFHPVLGWIALGGALLLLALAYVNEKLSRGAHEASQLDGRRAGRFADQSMANAEVARALGMVESLGRAWQVLSRKGMENQLQANRIGSVVTSMTRFARQFLQILILAAGAWLVIDQQATSGVMIAATILLSRALAPLETAISAWKGLVEARSAYGRLVGMFAAGEQSQSPTELPAPAGRLSLERVVFGFAGQERPVIKQVSFEMASGESLAIVGPSATGKSTLARLIVGIWKPAMGAVRLDGADIAAWPRERIGPYIGYLPQDVELFAGTVSQNIARMGEIDSAAVVEAAKRANAHDMILHLDQGYDTPIGDAGAILSAGQRQRVALARALYRGPRLVVLDEPNSNLDNDGEAALIEAVRRMKADGVTLVLVTHRGRLLAEIDKVLVLRDGAVEKFGPTRELLAPARPRVAEAALGTVAGIRPQALER
ncbi:MAG TPA: type I secretion system permease/ATPase [Burkholderiales bacterium]|nr:type I secretion system permease/ATPase [Burkholderiales bacterium]